MATPEDDVRDWLKAINLDRYLDNFINAGYGVMASHHGTSQCHPCLA